VTYFISDLRLLGCDIMLCCGLIPTFRRNIMSLVHCYLATLLVPRIYTVNERMISKYGTVGGVRIRKENRRTRIKPSSLTLCPPQIPRDVTWDRNRAVAAESPPMLPPSSQMQMKVACFSWVVISSNSVGWYRRFGVTCCLPFENWKCNQPITWLVTE
jgi:hypothetical protein